MPSSVLVLADSSMYATRGSCLRKHVISRALHVLDLLMLPVMPAKARNTDYSDHYPYIEVHLLDTSDHVRGTTSHHIMHVQRRQRKRLCTK